MKKIKILITSLIIFLSFNNVHSQVGIGTSDPKGALDIDSTTDGLLIPRVALQSTISPLPLTLPADSELVYNTSNNSNPLGPVTPGFYHWSSSISRWVRFVTGPIATPTGWLTTGNAGLNASTNFLGTTDAVDVSFRRANSAAGRIGATSTSFGVGALTNGATTNSTAIGNNALSVNTGSNNVALGQNALSANNTPSDNTAIGFNALRINTFNAGGGNQNTAVGSGALANLNGGVGNTAVGFNALNASATLSQFNTAVGAGALSGTNNAASQDNVAVGYNSLSQPGTITRTVAIGSNALVNAANNSTRNTAIGAFAGSATTTGNDNIFIGNSAGSLETGVSSNKLYISNSATNASNSLIYGEFAPSRILRTNSLFQIGDPDGTGYQFPTARGINNQVLQTNATGVLSWVNPGSLAITEVDPQVSSSIVNAIPKWNGTTLVDSSITDDGTNVTIAGNTITTNFQMSAGANANYILQSDAAGNATWVPNPLTTLSAMRSNITNNQILSNTGWQKIDFNSVVFDTKNEFAGGTFTAATAGIYQVNAGMHTDNQSNSEFYSIGVYVNGTLYQETTGNHFGNGPVHRNINCMVNLNAGGFVEIYIQNYQIGVQVDSFAGKSFFEVSQIR